MAENIGEWADTLDNLLGATQLPLPPQMHVDALRESLTTMRDEMRAAYVEATGENPWSTDTEAETP